MGVKKTVLLPDIGDFEDVDIVEVLVAPGDKVDVEDTLITLETDKASMEVPSPYKGIIVSMGVQVGGTISEGDAICVMDVEEVAVEADDDEDEVATDEEPARPAPSPPRAEAPPRGAPDRVPAHEPSVEPMPHGATRKAATAHASPAVRQLSRELGVDLTLVAPSGRKGRVLKEDVQGYVKTMLGRDGGGGVPIAGISVMRAPEIDFAKFGPTELQPLNRVRKLSGANLHRSWISVPHVTQHDEADITELEAFRREQRAAAEARGVKLTFLPLLMKVVASALKEFPHFNSSLDRTGENLIVKSYWHIGVAVDTAQGLVVPVVRDVDQKGILELASELMEMSARARERKLKLAELQGGTFTISSLGGIGGGFFTPIVNHPEVAVLGVARSQWRPVYRGEELERRLILPLSLSYDHRVIDGADAVRFTTRLAQLLTDLRLVLL